MIVFECNFKSKEINLVTIDSKLKLANMYGKPILLMKKLTLRYGKPNIPTLKFLLMYNLTY